MALGFGQGGEQNAPLGRAVIGGLMVATLATLFFVPVAFSVVHRRGRIASLSDARPRDAGAEPGIVAAE
jgi:Cu/Ag efflux pump CusA